VTAELARAGGPIACAGLALLFVARGRYERLAGLAAAVLGAAALAVYLAPHGHRQVLAGAAVVGLIGAALLAAVFHRWPWLIALAALACTPARIPVSVGSTEANLLVPLYAVVAGAALLLAFELLYDSKPSQARELGPLAWPLALFVAWSGLSLAWSEDLHQGAINLLFFFVPFGLLTLVLARLPWRRLWLQALYAELTLMALVFAAVGLYQYATRDVFWNPKVIVGNAYAPFYRVNSVFWDPSIYGRFLVVAISANLVIALLGRDRRLALYAGLAICAIWAGLLFSFSQSSFAALIVGTVVASFFVWRWRAVAALGLVAAVILSVGFSAGPVRSQLLHKSSAGLNNATSGRTSLIANGIRIALHHPVAGVGLGAFKRAYADRLHLRGEDPKKAASHDTPVTVAAETGIPGLALLVWLLVVALTTGLRRIRRTLAGRARLVFALALAAIAVHSLFYNALFEDPMFWGMLAFIASGAAVLERQRKRTATA
jgi:putative inorganic carbon (HCO3(-)) transporter